MDSTLAHYGVLGMKWGVRRTPEQLGHRKIKAGTKMYRATANASESTSGNKYVTYLPPDRDMYRGTFANGIRKYYGKNSDSPLYEKEYTLKKDLNIPSRQTLQSVINKVRSEDKSGKVATELGKAYIKNYAGDSWSVYENILQERYEKGKSTDITADEYKKELKAYQVREGKKFAERLKDMDWYDYYKYMTDSFGPSSYNREKVISELKKMGYNAMVDEAGVGGGEQEGRKRVREGVDPLIIFDGDDVLEERQTRTVTKAEQDRADRKHKQWYSVANSSENEWNNW